MPHRGKKRFRNKDTVIIKISKKKKKLKLTAAQNGAALVVKNLPPKATEEGLQEFLNKYGDICEIKMLKKANGNFIGRGVVQFSDKDDAEEAVKCCNGKDFMGKKIVLDWAVPKVKVKKESEEKEEPDSKTKTKTENKQVTAISDTTQVTSKERKKMKNAKKSRLIVRNLPFKVTEEILRKHFEKFGEISELTLLRKADGKLVGCGFIQFARKNSAAKAIINCSGKPLLGRMIIVDWAVPKSTFKASESSEKEVEIKKEPGEEEEIDEKDSSMKEKHSVKSKAGDDDDDDDNDDDDDVVVDDEDNDKSKISDSEDETDEEIDENESEDESEKKTDVKRPRVISNDVSEGRTVFIKNVPFSSTNEDLKACMEQFGPVVYALICMDPITEHSKGTAFVKFQKKESAEQCLSAGTELTLHDQTLDVYRALNREEIQRKAENKNAGGKNKDNRNLYLVKEGVVLAGSSAAVGVSMADMAKRLQIEQWKSQMLRNLNMFVSRYRLVIHNIPPSWDDSKLRQLFIRHAGPKAVIKEARVMRDMRNVDAQGIGKSKEYGFVTFTMHENALQALRNINNNPNIFTSAKRPVVNFSIENKAIMNIKQKRLEKSRARNPLCSDDLVAKPGSKKRKQLRKVEDSSQRRLQNDGTAEEEGKEFVGTAAKPGNRKLRARFKLRSQADIHNKSVRKAKHAQKMKHKFEEQKKIRIEKLKESQPKKGVKRKHNEEEDNVFNKLVNKYKDKLMSVPLKKWYE